MTIQNTAEQKPKYPTFIQVDCGGTEKEIAHLHRIGINGALYKTDGCLVYHMTRDGIVLPLLY